MQKIAGPGRLHANSSLRFSSLFKLQKSVAWLLCFKECLCYKNGRATSDRVENGSLTVGKIARATREIVKTIQCQEFHKELELLQRFPQEHTTSSVTAMPNGKKLHCMGYVSPLILDGVICVGGRMDRASLGLSAKHRMLLPRKHHVTDLIIRDCHERKGHMGASQVLASIRQRFCILQGKAAVRRVVGKSLK